MGGGGGETARKVGKHEVCTRRVKNPRLPGLWASRRDVMGNRFVKIGWAHATGDFE